MNKTVITHEDIKKYIQAAGKCASNAKRIWNTEKPPGQERTFSMSNVKLPLAFPLYKLHIDTTWLNPKKCCVGTTLS